MAYMNDLKKYLSRRKSDLDKDFVEWRDHGRDLRDYILPWAGRDLAEMNGAQQETSGRKRQQYIYDSTATVAIESLGAGLFGNLTSPGRHWFDLTTPDPELAEDYDTKVWLEDVEKLMYEVFRRSNLYQSFRRGFTELPTFGTWACAVLDDDEDIIHVEPYTYGEYRLGQSDKGYVNIFLRRFYTTARQAVQWWGIDGVSPTIKRAYTNGNQEQQFPICHLVEPNDEMMVSIKEANGFAFRSIYWVDIDDNFVLETAGFHEFPVLAPRWAVNGNRVYGNSPCMTALPDIKQLQLMTKDKMTIIGKMANPPMVSKGIKWQDIDTAENGVSYANGGTQSLETLYEPQPHIVQVLFNDIIDLRQRINKELYVDLFRLMMDSDRREMTAREVSAREGEKLMLLGPVVESMSHEMLDPLINRVFNIMWRRGMIPDPPEIAQNAEIKVEYTSPLAQASKVAGVNALERFLGFAGGILSIRPEAGDKIDADEILNIAADGYGINMRVLKADRDVQKIRQARAQAAQQERAVAMEQQVADGAKTMAETQLMAAQQGGM